MSKLVHIRLGRWHLVIGYQGEAAHCFVRPPLLPAPNVECDTHTWAPDLETFTLRCTRCTRTPRETLAC